MIAGGVESQWTLANEKDNELCRQVFGDREDELTPAMRRRYYTSNQPALEAFIGRKEGGLGLSDRVWDYSEQFREEIELALDAGIRDGLPATRMATRLKAYLKHPDKLFRRVRDDHGQLRLSKAAKAYHPGRGVYRSSYKNARRLAATETNMAYRTADHLRWQQMDFVVGQRVVLSNNHTLGGKRFRDICDDLSAPQGSTATSGRGCYPKDFKFTGWHPLCRCHAEPILKTPEEMQADTRRILAGGEPATRSANEVKDVPQGFKDWIEDNKERMERAKSLPYFIRDNFRDGDPNKSFAWQDYVYRVGKGSVEVHHLVSSKDSDYKKLIQIAEYFAREGATVKLTPKMTRPPKFQYGEIYGSLVGTKYERKCPDLNIDGKWYEHEGFITDNPKKALRNMLNDGLKQSDRLIIDRPNLTMRYMERRIFDKITKGDDIKEIWIRNEDGTLENTFTKRADGQPEG